MTRPSVRIARVPACIVRQVKVQTRLAADAANRSSRLRSSGRSAVACTRRSRFVSPIPPTRMRPRPGRDRETRPRLDADTTQQLSWLGSFADPIVWPSPEIARRVRRDGSRTSSRATFEIPTPPHIRGNWARRRRAGALPIRCRSSSSGTSTIRGRLTWPSPQKDRRLPARRQDARSRNRVGHAGEISRIRRVARHSAPVPVLY